MALPEQQEDELEIGALPPKDQDDKDEEQDEFDDIEDFDDDEDVEDELPTDVRDYIKETTGKDITKKSALAKTLNQIQKDFAQKPPVKRENQPVTPKEHVPAGMSERLLKLEHKESSFVMDELRKTAESTGQDILELYEGSSYFQKEARARLEIEKNKQRVGKPNGGTDGTPEETITPQKKVEQKMLDPGSLPPGMKFLPKSK